MSKTVMNFAEALAYQDAFEAVIAGTATHAQAIEVDAVVNGVHRYMQAAGAAAGKIMDARINLLAAIPEDQHGALAELLDRGSKAAPRILFYRAAEAIVTPAEKAALDAQSLLDLQAPDAEA